MKSPAKCFPSTYRTPYNFLLQFQLFTYSDIKDSSQKQQFGSALLFLGTRFGRKLHQKYISVGSEGLKPLSQPSKSHPNNRLLHCLFPRDGSKAQTTKFMYKSMCNSLNLKQNEAQSTCAESTNKGVN